MLLATLVWLAAGPFLRRVAFAVGAFILAAEFIPACLSVGLWTTACPGEHSVVGDVEGVFAGAGARAGGPAARQGLPGTGVRRV